MKNGSYRLSALPLALLRGLLGFGGDRRGNIAAMTALLIVPLVGAMGMAVETADWYLNQRALQNAADSAALSAGLNAGTVGGTSCAILPGDFDCEAKAAAAQYGFTDGSNNVSVTVTCKATTAVGSCAAGTCPGGVSQCYTVTITKKLAIALTQLVGYQGDTTIGSAKAVTIYASASSQPSKAGTGGGCILALGTGNPSGAVEVTGGAVITANGCGVYDDSNNASALIANNSGTIKATSINVVGGLSESGAPVLTPTPVTHAAVANDPYNGNITAPTVGSNCDKTSYSIGNGNTATISASGSTPYIFCGGLAVQGAAQLTLTAGTYVINGGSFAITNGTTVNATAGVTIYLTNGATFAQSGGTTFNITAPTTGNTAGIAIWDSASGGTVNLTNGAVLNMTGAMYIPGDTLNLAGGFGNTSSCTQIIANVIDASNGISLNSSCTGTGVRTIGNGGSANATIARLVL